MTSLRQLLLLAKADLKESSSPDLDARILLSFVLKKTKEWILSNPKETLSDTEKNNFEALIERRKKGEPIAYIIGHKEFFGLDFLVTPDVLIPRPETEILVEEVLKYVKSLSTSIEEEKVQQSLLPNHYNLPPISIADVGTGSGAIAITLAKNLPSANIYAFDISKKSLAVAKNNASIYKIKKIKFVENDLLSGVRQKFDIVCANLPYLDKGLKALLASSKSDIAGLKFEPKIALAGGNDGLDLYKKLIPHLKYVLKSSSAVFLEIGTSAQAEKLSDLIKKHLPASNIEIKKDLAGLDRIIVVKT